MVRDSLIWRSALLVAVFNVALYSYYDLGPFVFQRLHLGTDVYGYSGALLALGSSLGAWFNRRWLKAGTKGENMLRMASVLMLGSALGVAAEQRVGPRTYPAGCGRVWSGNSQCARSCACRLPGQIGHRRCVVRIDVLPDDRCRDASDRMGSSACRNFDRVRRNRNDLMSDSIFFGA
jgi:hypothetical protein